MGSGAWGSFVALQGVAVVGVRPEPGVRGDWEGAFGAGLPALLPGARVLTGLRRLCLAPGELFGFISTHLPGLQILKFQERLAPCAVCSDFIISVANTRSTIVMILSTLGCG